MHNQNTTSLGTAARALSKRTTQRCQIACIVANLFTFPPHLDTAAHTLIIGSDARSLVLLLISLLFRLTSFVIIRKKFNLKSFSLQVKVGADARQYLDKNVTASIYYGKNSWEGKIKFWEEEYESWSDPEDTGLANKTYENAVPIENHETDESEFVWVSDESLL